MKKYMLKRILFSLFSLIVVVMTVMILVYSLTERSVIFQTDTVWIKKNFNEKTEYEYRQYQKYGYLDYYNYTEFLKLKYKELYGDDYINNPQYNESLGVIQYADRYLDNPDVQEWLSIYRDEKGYEIVYLTPMKYSTGKLKPGGKGFLLAIHEKSVFTRLWEYAKGFITIETTNQVKDENLTDRYIRFEKDPYSGAFAIVGSGTLHKYLLYFDGRFPFIHQNFIHINLGTSYTRYRGQEITAVMNTPTGNLKSVRTQLPTKIGTDEYIDSAIDFHSLTYNMNPESLTDFERGQFPDNYTVYTYKRTGLTMLENSFVIGLIATLIAYLLGLPIGILMARRKDKFADKLGNAYIIFIMAVPSLAYIFLFAMIGTRLFNLPYAFANAEVKVLAYFLPTISLALPSIGGLMKWMRRYMIDQMNSDYVKFARAEGLSEREIFSKHISKNAMIFLVHGIPGNILSCLTGAIITERVYAVPGVGGLLTEAINQHDNGIIIASTVFYTTLSIISLILGDLLLAKYDPRISLSKEGGGGR